MSIELLHLRQVIALAEHGSFVRAAKSLHLSQPALSRSIQSLEKRLGSELFLRSSGGVVPTDLGRLYVERARDLLRMADELDRDALGDQRLRTGRVDVGGGPFPSEAVLGRAAARFVDEFPGGRVRVQTRDWDDLLRQLRSRELDFFVAETSTLQQEPDVDIAPMLASHRVYFLVRPAHPLATRGRVTAADILEWPLVAPGRIPPRMLDPILPMHREACRRIGISRPLPSVECNSLATAKRIVACSDSVTASILSCFATELESGQMVLLGTEPWLHLQYGIVSLRRRPWTQAAEKFRDLVIEAERAATLDEERLAARFSTGGSGRDAHRARRKSG
jgi:DNA-binding transcriptional LysR family regulator